MTHVPHDKGDKWDHADVASLLALYQDDESIEKIASALGRTKGGVRSKLYRLHASRK